MLTRCVILITGGTGSLGQELTRQIVARYAPAKVIIFSRDELKQHEMRRAGFDQPCMRYFIGNVRDMARLRQAFAGVDVVIHTAALKQVPACEYNPFEAIKTNVLGAQNVIEAAVDQGVRQVLAVSSDKAVHPVNLYGATKLCAEKLFVHANVYARKWRPAFSCVRYGNVVGSRGSVIPIFLKQRETGQLTITDERMTRFWITLPQAAAFVLQSLADMRGGEVFVPRVPSMRVVDLARAIAPDCEHEVTGIRPGEKLHEILVSTDESRYTYLDQGRLIILPASPEARGAGLAQWEGLPQPHDGFSYASDTNDWWLTEPELAAMIHDWTGQDSGQ